MRKAIIEKYRLSVTILALYILIFLGILEIVKG